MSNTEKNIMVGKKTKAWKGLAKKGMIFCTVGVMAFSMMACGGTGNTAKSTETKTETTTPATEEKTTKSESTTKKSSSTAQKSGTTNKSAAATKK